MQVHTFIVDSAAEAVRTVRSRLGPNAVVLSVRRAPADGLSALWKKPRIEVLAIAGVVPATEQVSAAPPDPLLDLRRELSAIREEVRRARDPAAAISTPVSSPVAEPVPGEDFRPEVGPFPVRGVTYPGGWRAGPILEATGLMPVHALRIVELLCREHGEAPPAGLGEELLLAAKALQGEWIVPPTPAGPAADAHVFVGPPGSGKTTALCKRLAQAVLVESRPASVWRLDGATANTAESLGVYAEILGVPVERSMPASRPEPGTLLLIDLPGVPSGDTAAVADLGARLRSFGPVTVHLVLNAAYDSAVSSAQARAFLGLGVTDVVATHLDEEPRWGKLWNWILGMNCPIGRLGVGQNVPGEFHVADPGRILTRQFARDC
jgi:flagellar biosynthesis protein FlhF